MSAMLAIGVCACGGVGAAARYICDSYIKALWRKNVPAFDVCHQCCGRSACRLGGGIVRGEHHKPRLPPTARNRISRRFLNVLNHDERDGYAPAQWENRLFHRLCAGFDRRARHGRCVRLLAGLSQRKRDSKITSECRDWLQSARSMQPRSGLWESRYTDEKKFTKERTQQLFRSVGWVSGKYPETSVQGSDGDRPPCSAHGTATAW